MTIKQLNIRPEDWYGTRELSWIPRHFTQIQYVVQRNNTTLAWIMDNTAGRYAFGQKLVTRDGKLVSRSTLAFEDPAEATLFTLSNSSPKYFDLF